MAKILAADIGGTALKVGLVEKNKVFGLKKVPSRAGEGREAVLKTLSRTFDSFKKAGFKGIGVSTAGSVNVKTGTIYYATNAIPGWAGTNLKKYLQDKYGLPVYVENDGRAAAVAEMAYGAARNTRNFIFITIGTGLGGAVVQNRKITDSSKSVRPEGLGHFLLVPGGFTCSCGKKGCWEAQASITGILKKFGKACSSPEKKWDAKKIFDKAEAGHAGAGEAVQSFLSDLGRGLSVLSRRYHPEKIVLGGAVSERGTKFIRAVQASLKRFNPAWGGKIEASSMGNNAGLVGAAYLAAQTKEGKRRSGA